MQRTPPLVTSPLLPRVRNVILASTTFWNPDDDFVRDGVIQVLHQLLGPDGINLLFYNGSPDFPPAKRSSGIGNDLARGDLERHRANVDAIIIAGRPSGDSMRDLLEWILANQLEDRVLLLGAACETPSALRQLSREPAAAVLRKARLVVGSTPETPAALAGLGSTCLHLNCPSILAARAVRNVSPGRKLERIGFSIQLEHGQGLADQSCSPRQFRLALEVLRQLSTRYAVEVIAHHKTEYFHFLKALRGLDIPVLFSSFHQDLSEVYPRYDLIVTTRPQASLFANSHGIPGIVISDSDSDAGAQVLKGVPHSTSVTSQAAFDIAFAAVQAQDPARVATAAAGFKQALLQRYVAALSAALDIAPADAAPAGGTRGVSLPGPGPVTASPSAPASSGELPVHFFTLVLNGRPFLEHHIKVFESLPFAWHWHVVEGVAELNHDTAWSRKLGGRIRDRLHRNGLSHDGTSEYLDELVKRFPDRVTVYRKPPGTFWDGKVEMANAPLANVREECLLWQVDSDELWTSEQIRTARELFLAQPDKTAAYYFCHYFVGEKLVITTRDTYGNHPAYEWIRTWRYTPGCRWTAHEPPQLCRPAGPGQWTDLAGLNPLRHAETEAAGLVFQHFAYVTPEQLQFKETYYGYAGAPAQWRRLQEQSRFPVPLRQYFAWVNDGAEVNTADSQQIVPLATRDDSGTWHFAAAAAAADADAGADPARILFVRTDAIGDGVLAASMLPWIRRRYPRARLAVLCRQQVSELYLACPHVDTVICFDWDAVNREAEVRAGIVREIADFQPDLILNSMHSREMLTENLITANSRAQLIGMEGDLANISPDDRDEADARYTRLVPSVAPHKPELERHQDFLTGIGIAAERLEPMVWTTPADDAVAEEFFRQHRLDPEKTIALFPGSQHEWKIPRSLSAAVASLTDYRFLIFGGPEVSTLAGQLAAELPGRCVDLAGQTSLREMAALFRKCRLYVGADSAGAHLACAVGLPNVVVLGGGHFGRFLPYSPLTSIACLPLECYGCGWACKFQSAHCVKDVDVRVVSEAVRRTLAGAAPLPRVFIQSARLWQDDASRPRWKNPEAVFKPGSVEVITVDAQAGADPLAGPVALARDAEGIARQVIAAVADPAVKRRVLGIISGLEKDHWLERNLATYSDDAPAWFDAATFLNWHARHFQPGTYLEVGVRRGRSMAQVLVESPQTQAFGFDLWIPGYGSIPEQGIHTTNPGPDFVRAELRRLGVRELPTLVPGDSAQTLPAFFANPASPAQVDLIFVDGDHTCAGARRDLDLAFAHLAPGGALVFDDINNPHHLDLRDLWLEYQARFSDCLFLEDSRGAGTGVAFRPPFDRLRAVLGRPSGANSSSAGEPADALRLPASARQDLDQAEQAFNRGDLAAAAGHLTRAVRQAPSSAELRTSLANLHLQLGNAVAALEQISEAARLRPDDALTHVLLASVHLRLEQVEEFEAALARALQLDADQPAAHRLLADLNLQHGRFADAARGYARLLQATPGQRDPGLLLGLARCFVGAGDTETARLTFEEVLGVDPQNVEAKEGLSRLINSGTPSNPPTHPTATTTVGTSAPAGPIAAPAPAAAAAVTVAATVAAPTDQPLVSVIVSTYAAEKYIRACLEDLLRQTIADRLEILVIDSGSPENERAIVEEFQKRHPNIRYCRTERETLYAAWNRAIGMARGRYVANANCDDSHRCDALELLASALEAHPEADLAYGDYYTSTVANDTFEHPHILRRVTHPPYHPATVMLYCVTGCHPMWRKTVFDQVGLFDPTYTAPGDHEFLLRFVRAGRRAVHIPQPLSLFFQNAEGLSWKSAAKSRNENNRLLGVHRSQMPIERLFRVDPSDATAAGKGWVALGNLAIQHEVPWLSNYVQDLPYAQFCYEQALKADPHSAAALHNRRVVRLLQQRTVDVTAALRMSSPDLSDVSRQDLSRGLLQLVPVPLPAAVDPIEHGPRFSPRTVPNTPVPVAHAGPASVVRLPVRVAAPFLERSGPAADALQLVLPLASQVNLATADNTRNYSAAFDEGLAGRQRTPLLETRSRFNFLVGGIGISAGAAPELQRFSGALFHVGRTMYEADRLPLDWVKICNQMDELWVPSRFNLELFAASGVERDKLVVIPSPVDADEFDPARVSPLPLPRPAGFNFLAVFDWCTRKGWDALLGAYLREFTAADDVCLYLRTRLPANAGLDARAWIDRQIKEFIRTLSLDGRKLPRIEVLADELASEDMPRLYRAVDCVVAPSRGEAWGRVPHEAMLMALPVIATGWGGVADYLTAETGYPIDFELVDASPLEAEQWQFRGRRWANPSEAHLRTLMRQVQQDPVAARARGAKARSHMRDHFSPAAVSERVLERLRAIEARLTVPGCPPLPERKAAPVATTGGPVASGASRTKPITVALEGSFLDLGSLSHVNRELSLALSAQPGLSVTCVARNVVPPELSGQRLLVETARRLKYPAPRNAQVTIRHAWPPDWTRPAAGAWVLVQPWEYGVLPIPWIQHLSEVDEIWVPSENTRRAYVESGVDPAKVAVVPNGINPALFRPEAKPMALPTRKKFKLLFVGGTIHRKGPDLLLQAFLENFTAADDVCLVIKDFGGQGVYAGQTFEAQIREAQARPNAPEILHLTADLEADALPGLYTACDCLVHPYRGEGFGLPVLEAMACGLPVIVTGGGSTDDFVLEDFACRLPALKKEIPDSVGDLKLVRHGWLLEPDVHELGQRMKWVVAHPEQARARGQAASAYAREHWTWQRAAQVAAERLRSLVARPAGSPRSVGPRTARAAKPIVLPTTAKLGHLGEARALWQQGQPLRAWDATMEAIKARPFHPEAFLLLAEIALACGAADRARELAARSRRMAPNWKPAQQFAKARPPKQTLPAQLPPLPPMLQARPQPARLSVFLITRNEEQFLGRCLESIRDVADQVVVVDTGSTDWTTSIAARYGAEVYHFDWQDDFSAARNAALERVRGDWVLMLDADEELLPGQKELLREAMQDEKAIALRLPITDIGREDEGVSYVPRLFRNAPGLFYVGRVHEQVFSSLEARRAEWGLENKLGEVRLLHHGYVKEVVKSRDKLGRNLRLLQKALDEFPDEPNLLMNLGLELVRAGRVEAGLEEYESAFVAMGKLPPAEVVPELRETLLTQYCTHLLGMKNYAAVSRVLKSPLAVSAGLTASQHWLLGLACLESGRIADGAEHMRQCLAKRNRPALSPINRHILKAGPHHCLGLCLAGLQQPDAADKAFRAALECEARSLPVLFDYARFLAGNGREIDALQRLHELTVLEPSDVSWWLFGAQVALSKPEFLEFACDWTGEAARLFPAHPGLSECRGQALLLRGQLEEAMAVWRPLASTGNPSAQAALVICTVASGQPAPVVPLEVASRVNQECVSWYRRLLAANTVGVVQALNSRLDRLRQVLPGAARILGQALAEADDVPVK